MKQFVKKHPIYFTIILVSSLLIAIYLYLMISVFRPYNMIIGRMKSIDKNWSEIQKSIKKIKVGAHKSMAIKLLGEPDSKFYFDSSYIWTYEEYGILAPDLVYEVEFHSDTISKIYSYHW
ncbi:MAG: hypothetical protein KA264_00335 [Crocinitomicaceae bacterium]|jgi:hypothetical protein|nr:hypothetical protein [Crocinitomicaceae bacterium]